MAAPNGAIVVYRLDGSVLMSIANVDRPNNIDVAYGLKLGIRKMNIAVATERNTHRLRVFAIIQFPGKVSATWPTSQSSPARKLRKTSPWVTLSTP